MGPAEYVQKYADWKAQAEVVNDLAVPNDYEQQNYASGTSTDWLKKISRSGLIQDHTVSVTGGSQDVKYYVSADYFSEKGVMLGYQSRRGSIRSNIDANLTSYLNMGVNLYLASTNNDGGRANLQLADQISPYGRFKDPDGTYTIFPMSGELAFQSPMLSTISTRNERRQNIISNVYAELKPLPGLKYRINAGYTFIPGLFQSYTGRLAGDIAGGTAQVENTERKNWIVENILTYEKNFGKNHLDATALYSAQEIRQFSGTSNATGFINDALEFNSLQGASTFSASSEAVKTNLVSQMLRVNYSYDSRYLVTATARRDGYSAFGSNTDKYGIFPSLAVGWNISNEAFMKNVKFFNNLKLRGSYGLSGNQSAVIPYSTISTFTTISIPSNGHPTTGVIADALGNNDLKWESTYGSNIGIDFAVLNNRISGTIETYNTRTKDLVLYRTLPSATGYSQTVTNIGKVANTGFELTLRTQNVAGADFHWETSLNFSTNKNRILDLYGDKKDDLGNRLFIGRPVNVVYDYVQSGVWKVGEDPSKQDPGATPGDLKFKDLNGDGVIATDGTDQRIIGQQKPKWTGGITNTFTWRNLRLNIFIQTVQGVTRDNQAVDFVDYGGRQNLPGGLGYWTDSKQSNVRPKLTYVNFRGYNYAEDASFTRIKDATLSFSFPKKLTDQWKIGGAMIYLSGRNLVTFTHWFGWDPEAGFNTTGDTQFNYPWFVHSFLAQTSPFVNSPHMKSNKIFIVTVLAAIGLLPACTKAFLKEKVYSSFTPEALNDSLAFEAGIVGLQSQYSLWNTMNEDANGNQGFLGVWQMGTDVAYNKAPDDLDPMTIPYTNYEKLSSADVSVAFVWKWAYNIINNANVVIANTAGTKAPVSEDFKNRIKGQSMFYRGLAYNYLATIFGAVPLVTEPATAAKTDFVRAAVADINAQIVSDLVFARENAPSIDDLQNKSLPNKAMASQLLAEAYLRIGGKDADAEAACDEIINNAEFSLVTARYGVKASQPGDPFADMFIFGNQRRNQGNTEAIWVEETENPATVPNGAGPDLQSRFPGFRFTGSQHRRVWGCRYYNEPGMLICDSLGGRGISRLALTHWVLNLYGPNDMRNSKYNIRREFYYNDPSSPDYGKRVQGPGVDTNRNIVPKTNKWDQFDPNDEFGSSMIKDFIIMRLGETYLLKAEAQFKQGNLAGAAESINVLRTRAHAGAVTAGEINLDFILDERVRELVAEENRRMTLMRTGTLVERVKGRGEKVSNVSANNLLLPIPQAEISLNKDAVMEQNPGY